MLFLQHNPTKSQLGKPYHSTQGIPYDIGLYIFFAVLIFSFYIGVRVYSGAKKLWKK
jgi:hypothetical protein